MNGQKRWLVTLVPKDFNELSWSVYASDEELAKERAVIAVSKHLDTKVDDIKVIKAELQLDGKRRQN